jgi:hypothetical protein
MKNGTKTSTTRRPVAIAENYIRHAELLPAWLVANGYGDPPDSDGKPVTHQNLDAFAIKRMTELPNWVCWRWERRKGENRFTKVPYIAGTTGLALKAASDHKGTWRPHDVALNRHVERVFDPSRKDKHWGRKLKRDE